MSIHRIYTTQKLPISIQEAWDFFSSPHNLKIITPPYMGFDITEKHLSEKIYPGLIITYKVSPLFNIKMNWVTEITHVQVPEYFVDEQRFGPYSFWHHKHFIQEIPGGVEVIDLVHYKIPLGFIGDILNALYIKSKLNEIFSFRYHKLHEIFGKYV
jgi:ligand-binding SRPBCC domain-containing protein